LPQNGSARKEKCRKAEQLGLISTFHEKEGSKGGSLEQKEYDKSQSQYSRNIKEEDSSNENNRQQQSASHEKGH
jgi:hypothetical protein